LPDLHHLVQPGQDIPGGYWPSSPAVEVVQDRAFGSQRAIGWDTGMSLKSKRGKNGDND